MMEPSPDARLFDVVLHLKRPSAAEIGHPIGASNGEHANALHFRVPRYAYELFSAVTRNSEAGHAAASIEAFPVLEKLSKALGAAGIGADKLERNEENTMRLALVASLFDMRIPSATCETRRPVLALPKWRLKRIYDYVDNNLAEQITLADLAAEAGMSRMYFASQFRAATGLRPHDFILRKRIERAQHLLVSTSETLVNVALSVGFQTQAHFTTIFGKIVGDTPYRWRCEQLCVAA